jgi:OOP family OmpA-OmpF porin
MQLSRRRADAVVQYLAAEKNVDFNHIHTIGFGKAKPADEGKTRDARAKNRRVEVQIYSADEALAATK